MQTTEQTAPSRTLIPIVTVKDGRVVANSRDVAEAFDREHKNVLAAIDKLDCSAEFARLNFKPCSTPHPLVPGRMDRTFDLTRDGFVFLVMGFIGREAARFKEAYISAFNAMEEELRRLGSDLPDHVDVEIYAMPLRKADIALRGISIAERLFGPEGARRMWAYHKMPPCKGLLPGAVTGSQKDDGIGCLRHLLRHAAGAQISVGARLETALHDKVAAKGMKAFGIIPEALDLPGLVAIADAHPFLEQVFAETQWIGAWSAALATLPGARRAKRKMTFDGRQSGAVLVPRDTVLAAMFGRAALQ